jgi:anti-anti-sigma factor
MSKDSTVEIHYHDREMVVSPTLHSINRRKAAREFSAEVAAAIEQPESPELTDVVVDLGEVTWISSAGLDALIGLRVSSRASGVSLRLRSIHETVLDVFRLTRLERVFDFDPRSEARLARNA